MKWLALLLLAANAVFFGWRYEQRLQHPGTRSEVVAPLPPSTPSLTLISELGELPPLRDTARDEAANALPEVAGAAAPMPAVPPSSADAEPSPLAREPAADAASPGDTPLAASDTDAVAVSPPGAADSEAPAATAPASSVTATATPAPAPPESSPMPVSESPEQPTIVSRAVSGSGVASEVCINVGPFPDARNADAIEAWLAPRAANLHRVTQVMRRRQFFWVYLEPKNAEEAKASVADLTRKGVRDFLLVQRGGLQNAISLGLFSTHEAVNRRLSEISKQGFQPVVVPRIEVTDYDWLRANLAVGFTDLDAIPHEPLAGAAIQPLDCAKIAEVDSSP